MLSHSSEVRDQGVRGPARLRPQAGALPGLSERGARAAPSACVGVHTPVPRLPSPLCVCVPLLSAYEDTRHSGVGSTLMTFSLPWLHLQRPCFQMRPYRRWLGPQPFGGRGHSFCPRAGHSLWSACSQAERAAHPASGSVASIRALPISAAGLDALLGSWGGPALHQLPTRGFPVGQGVCVCWCVKGVGTDPAVQHESPAAQI